MRSIRTHARSAFALVGATVVGTLVILASASSAAATLAATAAAVDPSALAIIDVAPPYVPVALGVLSLLVAFLIFHARGRLRTSPKPRT